MRPKAASQIVREYVYVFGAVGPSDGKHGSLVLPWADTEAMSLFLGEISRRYPHGHILMFMDQASWHKAKGLKIPPNIGATCKTPPIGEQVGLSVFFL